MPAANTETIENYLKAIHALARESPAGEAGMKAIATMTGVTVGTASTMVRRMGEAKLVKYERFGGVRLTAKGERAAIDVVRRHRLIETFLVRTLNLDWSVVHDEAERLEHALSPVVIAALDSFLGHPSTDPHGDPIPRHDGTLREREGVPLPTLRPGASAIVARITDQSATFLRFAAASGLTPGAKLRFLESSTEGGTVRAQVEGHATVTLATMAAQRIIVKVQKEPTAKG